MGFNSRFKGLNYSNGDSGIVKTEASCVAIKIIDNPQLIQYMDIFSIFRTLA